MSKSAMYKASAAAALMLVVSAFAPAQAGTEIAGIGQPITDAELVNWDISVYFDGEGLPEGKGSLEEGEEIWGAKCAMCHGDFGEGARGYPKMIGASMEEFHETATENGMNVENRGVNNLWAHAPTLYDMIRRAMPFFMPQSLSNDETYSVTGYALMLAEVIEEDYDVVIDAEFIRNVKMPAVDLFYTDNRPDVKAERCMKDCYDFAPDVVQKTVQGDFTSTE